MVNLPSAKYHADMAGITHQNVEQTVFPVLVFGLLQVASFAVLVLMVQRNCKIRALHQLSFVLESQKALTAWVVATLSFRVLHFGTLFIVVKYGNILICCAWTQASTSHLSFRALDTNSCQAVS
jgi:hypothetical protein